ncbi:MAG: DNA polymerase III subunit beta [Candidatus Makana argininalis]
MKFIVERNVLLTPLQQVIKPLNNKSKLPILNNILLKVEKNYLILTGTDLDIEISVSVNLKKVYIIGSITVPALKFYDIFKKLPNKSEIKIKNKKDLLKIKYKNIVYYLSTIPSDNFPIIKFIKSKVELQLNQSNFKKLIESINFSMANQDVRYYLNGMLFEIKDNYFNMVSTDGHRLSLSSYLIKKKIPFNSSIIPRKGIIVLYRLLDNNNILLNINIGENHIQVKRDNYTFVSKKIDGNFPDYKSVIPKNYNKKIIINNKLFQQALSRALIISNEKFNIVNFIFTNNKLIINTNNSLQEQSEEIIEIIYNGNDIRISFNVNYILDVLYSLKCEFIKIFVIDEKSCIKIEDNLSSLFCYVIMPIIL